MFSSGGLELSKFSHLSTATRASGRSNPISINMVTIGGVGDLATGGGGGAGGVANGTGGGGRDNDDLEDTADGPALIERGIFLGGSIGGWDMTSTGGGCMPGSSLILPGGGGGPLIPVGGTGGGGGPLIPVGGPGGGGGTGGPRDER